MEIRPLPRAGGKGLLLSALGAERGGAARPGPSETIQPVQRHHAGGPDGFRRWTGVEAGRPAVLWVAYGEGD